MKSNLYELAVVMPVYNEAECILEVIQSWLVALSNLKINFIIIVLNDGSTDQTAEKLSSFASNSNIEIINKKNSGHGPTLLVGYHRAYQVADWVFQCDSDDEMKPDGFETLWQNRENFDALFGVRTGRVQEKGRKFISSVSRLVISLLFGRGVSDVNVPYRLMRSDLLKAVVSLIPADTFAPNIVISGVFSKAKVKIYEHPILHQSRKTGKVSLMKWRLWKCATKSFMQTIACKSISITQQHNFISEEIHSNSHI